MSEEKTTPANNTIPVETLINDFLAEGNKYVAVQDILHLAGSWGSETEKELLEQRIARELANHEELLPVMPGERYAAAEKLFNGAEFLIVPDALEIENNMLVPGHRFVPFMSSELFPSEITLREVGARKPQSLRDFSGHAEEIIKYHLLMGAETLFDFFAAEDEENIANARSSVNPMLKLSVLDMKKFYAETDFTEGDALMVKVVDYQQGIFEFRLENGKLRSPQKTAVYRTKLEQALENVTEELLPGETIIDQLRCMFANEETLLKAPLMSLDEILMENSAFDIAFDQDISSLVKRGEDDDEFEEHHHHHHHHSGECSCHEHGGSANSNKLPENVTIGSGEGGSLEEMLSKLYPMLNSVELDAILLDNFKNHDMDFNSFYARAFGETALEFADGLHEANFFNALEAHFEDMLENYPRDFDNESADIRSQIVEFTIERCSVLTSLAELSEDLEIKPELFSALAEVVILLDESLKLVNAPAALGDDFDFAEFRKGVEDALESGEEALAALRGVLDGND